MMLWFVVACFVPAFVVSLLGTAAMRAIAPRLGLIDRPSARKVHTVPTPLGGGIGIYLGFAIPTVFAYFLARWLIQQPTLPGWFPDELSAHLQGVVYRGPQLWLMIGAGTLISIMGLIDDKRPLPWQPRILLQFGIAATLVMSGVRGTLFVSWPWVGIVISVMWIVVLVNSFNFLDNMDALSSGIGLISSVIFAAVMLTTTSQPHWLVGGALLVLAGSLAGFLCHNWPPARIFMGDSGSMFIGLMLASMTIVGTFYQVEQTPRHVMFAPLCVLAVPLYDFTSVVLIRLSQGRSPFHADKSHFSHRLVEVGLSKRDAVLTVHLATLTTGLSGLALYRMTDWSGAAAVLAQVACVLALVAILETVGRKKNGN